jgi:23S rRNA (cytosine1962-C5)-methyltransferase
MGRVLEVGEVLIRKRGADRIRRGHLWVYRSDVVRAAAVPPGSIVAVREARGTVLGKAFYSSVSQIALRFVSRGSTNIDEDFFLRRFENADRHRERLNIDPFLSRRIFSEGDLLPGLIVDRYGDRMVVQSLIQGTDRLQDLMLRIVTDRYHPRTIFLRNDSKVRELEGLELTQECFGETLPDTLIVKEHGLEVEVSLSAGHKTGTYLDQQENHRAVQRYAFGRALDAFTYGGGFALHISGICDLVDAVDISAAAIQLGRSNAARNHRSNINFIEANVFDFMRQQFQAGVRYDTIILDPPAFAKNKESLPSALRGYKEINLRAMRLLRSGGILVTCSCSHHVSEAIFAEMLAEAATDAGCWARVLERRIQARDHPVLLTVPETLYLKCFVLQLFY